jgi:hypothetical protein
MFRLATDRQENLMSFVKHKLELADDFMEDATVYLQLHRFFCDGAASEGIASA